MSNRPVIRVPKPLTEQYSAPSGAVCITVIIPDALVHLYLMQGFIALLTDAENWEGPEDDRLALAGVWQQAYVDTDWSFCVPIEQTSNNSQVTFWHVLDFIESGAALSAINDLAQLTGFYYVQGASGAVGDERSQRVWLSEGDYQLDTFYVRLTNGCKLTVIAQYQPDSSQVTVINQLDIHGATARNQKASASFTLTKSGEYKIYWINNGVPTGGGNNMPLTISVIRKVAD